MLGPGITELDVVWDPVIGAPCKFEQVDQKFSHPQLDWDSRDPVSVTPKKDYVFNSISILPEAQLFDHLDIMYKTEFSSQFSEHLLYLKG